MAPLLTVVGVGVRRVWLARERYGSASSRFVVRGVRVVTASAVGAIAVQAAIARLPGWNPESLWADDLVYAATVRSQDLWSMITAPIHVAPGPFLIWRGLYALFPDPEWSLQLLPFACAIASIPVMALLVRSVTHDYGLAILAAALTALNPLLAHYTVFVHQFPFDFLVTALFLLAAGLLVRNRNEVDPRRFGWVALGGGLAAFFSVTSVFVELPRGQPRRGPRRARGWRRHRTRTLRILLSAAAYNARRAGRLPVSECPVQRDHTQRLREGVHAAGRRWTRPVGFLARNGRRLLELGLPSWGQGELTNPVTFFWPLPFLALGLDLAVGAALHPVPGTRRAGLLCRLRRRERFGGLPARDRSRGYLRVSAVDLSVHGRRARCHTGVAGTEARPAGGGAPGHDSRRMTRPLHVEYFDVNDVHLVDHLCGQRAAGRWCDSLTDWRLSRRLLRRLAGYHYWYRPSHSHGTLATIGRERTHYLFRGPSEVPSVERFLAESRATTRSRLVRRLPHRRDRIAGSRGNRGAGMLGTRRPGNATRQAVSCRVPMRGRFPYIEPWP